MTAIDFLFQDNTGQYVKVTGQVEGQVALKMHAALHTLPLPRAIGGTVPEEFFGSTPISLKSEMKGPFVDKMPSLIMAEVKFETPTDNECEGRCAM